MVGLHVEATSRCTLLCPRCERTTFIDKFGKNNFSIDDINIDNFIKFIDLKVDKVNFCGNIGDPIYHKNFLELIKITKTRSDSIYITTNGSRKNKSWWKELVSLLDERDELTFSVDGTPNNFTEYRINGDWESIRTGIDVCASSNVKTVWKYIPFSFNEDSIEYVRNLSANLGIDKFKLDISDRWNDNDYLRPKGNYIGPKDELQQKYKTNLLQEFTIDPECANNKMHYVSADGFYSPCCFSKNYEFWYKSEWYKNKMTIKNNKLSECIRRFEDFYATIQDSKPDYCLFNCGKC